MKNNKLKKLLFYFLIIVIILLPQIFANSYEPFVHRADVPKHPELKPVSILQIDPFTGAAIYNYEIELPIGTKNLAPKIILSYNSHLTKQIPSFLGTGWLLSSYDYIQRNTNYSFASTGDDYFELYFNGSKYDLVYASSENRWHTDVESFFYINNYTNTNAPSDNNMYWILRTKEGDTYRFGYNKESEMLATNHNYTWRWSLDLVNDTYNNSVFYNYTENPITGESGSVYPYKIQYNNDKNRTINFVLESSNRTDLWNVTQHGSNVLQTRRIQEIVIEVNGELVRRYVLAYSSYGSDMRTSLHNITIYGNDNITKLPVTTFNYENVDVGWTRDATWIPISDAAFTDSNDGTDRGVRFGDINGDGLADLIKGNDCSFSYCKGAWLNNGSGWDSNSTFEPPIDGEFLDSYEGSDQGVYFFDVNGDGRSDLVRRQDCDGAIHDYCSKAWLSTPSGWVENTTFELPQDAAGGQLMDLNGDGLSDILRACDAVGCSTEESAWINNRSGWVENTTWAPLSSIDFTDSSDSDTGLRVIDFNGDGLDDLIQKGDCGGSSCEGAWLNTGNGWKDVETSSNWVPSSSDITFVESSTGNDQGVRFFDINGDGLIDILKRTDCSSSPCKKIYLNNGDGWSSGDSSWIPIQEMSFTDSSGGENRGVRIADVNGDGQADLIKKRDCSSSPCENAYLNNAQESYLLKNITNEMGGVEEIVYRKSTYLDNTGPDENSDLAFNLWVVEQKVGKTGIINFTYNYSYTGGYYDHNKKNFYGFYQVRVWEDNQTDIEHYYYQDSVLRGRENITTIRNFTGVLYQNVSRIWVYTVQNGYAIPRLQTEIISTYDKDKAAGSPKKINTTYSYDTFGNILEKNFSGDYEKSGDEIFEKFEYRNNSATWVVSALINHTIFGFSSTNKVKQTFYSYDEGAYGVAPTKGSMTRKEEWLSGGTNPVTLYGYNTTTGNILNVTSPNGNITRYTYGISDRTNTFINKIVDSLGHTTYFFYNLSNGEIQIINDSNQILTNYTYDVFGRIKQEIQPYDTATFPTKNYTYNLDGVAPEFIIIRQREMNGTSSTFDTYYFYDGFGNLIQVKEETENNDQIVMDIFYDGINRMIKVSNPYFNDSTTTYTSPAMVLGTNYTYDPLNNVIKIINPDTTIKQINFTIWNVTAIDENGNKTKYILNAQGNIITVIEYASETTNVLYYTNYTYDPLQNLLKINDTLRNTFNYTFDTLGRMTKMQDPDLGTWNYFYDNVNNVKLQEDARGIKTEFMYDKTNRLVRKNSTDIFINYTYDTKLNDTLAQMKTNVSIINYTYDNRLRMLNQEQILNGRRLLINKTYDSSNKVITQRLPDGTIIVYNYTQGNELGLIGNITTSLVNISYNEFKSHKLRKYNNTLVTNLTYNSTTNKLAKINTSNIQILTYSYDAIGNLKKISDTVNTLNYTMLYDALSRLIFITITNNTAVNNTYNYTYDGIGNLLQIKELNQSTSLAYNGTTRHGPASMNTSKSIIIFSNSSIPTQNNPILNSTYGTNLTNENLTVYNISTHDPNSDPVKNIINWYRNTTSLLVLNLPMEGGSNDTYTRDYSIYNHTVTVLRAKWANDSGYDGFGAYNFTAPNQSFMNVSYTQVFNTTNWTIEAWVYPYDPAIGIGGVIVGKFKPIELDQYELRISVSPNKFHCGASNYTGFTFIESPIYPPENWYYLACVYNGSHITLYVNGALINTLKINEVQNNDAPVLIGGRLTGARFNGTIDDVKIWNASLTWEQINNSYLERTNQIHHSMTEVGQIWQAEIIPNDKYQDGQVKKSNTLTIRS